MAPQAEGLRGKHAYAGDPKPLHAEQGYKVFDNIGYSVGYSEARKDPLWSAYFCAAQASFTPGKRPKKFTTDERTDARVTHADYTQSDYSSNPNAYDRGHMSPNYAIASRYGREAQLETFLLSNICPQCKSLNQQTWEALEKTIAGDYADEFDGVWVVCGPIFKPHASRLNGVAEIPSAFFCIVIDEDEEDGSVRALAVIMTQETRGIQPLSNFVTTIDNVESQTGLDFLTALPDAVENAVESSKPDERWHTERMLVPSSHDN